MAGIVVRVSIDGLLKNGRIGCDARQTVMINQTRQSPVRQQAAVDVTESDALAERLYFEQRVCDPCAHSRFIRRGYVEP